MVNPVILWYATVRQISIDGLDSESLKLIESKNEKDLDLYFKAQSIFERRLEEMM
ncbi:hypothetical protein ARTHRO_50036 [Limnospira indica PCC 8005]|uniref:Uncharacterized protein n=1 Tax=Limnospira indica PCC 8005 TaxID=376219 RepID=A0A9P1KJL6_9CYAN|nr:hypothetical protein ARTHRO_50036 [Limnospira indica PCC 8005]